MRWQTLLAIGLALVGLTGCAPIFSEKARFGVTFYCPGAGNVDFGDSGIREGLQAAGYPGDVATVLWTVLFNPAIDQTLRINARLGGARLARLIEEYSDRFPNRPINVVGLSAGTGVAIWALEDLRPGYQVDNVVLLASSLHYRYDVSKALRRVRGKIHNFYSSQDAILSGPMKIFGTIDGVFFDDGAGAVGLQPPNGSARVVNIAWRSEFERYGYYGGHVDVTSAAFVQAQIAPRLMPSHASVQRETALAIAPRSSPPPGSSDRSPARRAPP